eukprot:IDg11241t1
MHRSLDSSLRCMSSNFSYATLKYSMAPFGFFMFTCANARYFYDMIMTLCDAPLPSSVKMSSRIRACTFRERLPTPILAPRTVGIRHVTIFTTSSYTLSLMNSSAPQTYEKTHNIFGECIDPGRRQKCNQPSCAPNHPASRQAGKALVIFILAFMNCEFRREWHSVLRNGFFLKQGCTRFIFHMERQPKLHPRYSYYQKRATRPRCCVEEQPAWKKFPLDKDVENNAKLVALEKLLDEAWYKDDNKLVEELREKIGKLQSMSYVEVLSANLSFYNAFSHGSLVDMASCWMQDNTVMCKHPLGPMFTGFWKVMDSFEAMFYSGIANIRPLNVRISVRGSVAVVTCEEYANPSQDEEVSQSNVASEWNENFSPERAEIRMNATNIFEKKNGQFYLVYHVSSPITPII